MRVYALVLGGMLRACGEDPSTATPATSEVVVVSFNVGTTPGLPHDDGDAYTPELAELADALLENSLAYVPAEEAAARVLQALSPDVVGFQEMFHDPWCDDIVADPLWTERLGADPQVALRCAVSPREEAHQALTLLGADYQVACLPGRHDKCVAIHARFGRFVGCDDALCEDHMAGEPVPGCGSGPRVGRAVVERPEGGTSTVAFFHGSSGLSGEDQACRVAQLEQLLVDLGDGQPAALEGSTFIVGDFNMDPARSVAYDDGAVRWAELREARPDLHWHAAPEAHGPTYQGLGTIDWVATPTEQTRCEALGISPGTEAVFEGVYFDHVPLVCRATAP